MRAYRVEKVVSKNGSVSLEALPFKEGEVVEIIVLSHLPEKQDTSARSLKNSVIEYKDPTEPIALDDWDVLQ